MAVFLAEFHWSGADLRGDLTSAAAELRSLPADAPSSEIERAVAGAFIGRSVTVDPARFRDLVTVTVHNLDRNACLRAQSGSRRIEGLVVIELVGYRSADECGTRNDMTWRLMP